MMTPTKRKQMRTLAVAPSTRGFGFALIEAQRLVDWGIKSVKGEKNKASVSKVEALLALYKPEILVLEDASADESRRSPRIRLLTRQLAALAETHGVEARQLTRLQVRHVFFHDEKGTKEGLAQMLAQWFPEELGLLLPPKRRPWMSEDCRMNIFEAVALALALSHCKSKRPGADQQVSGA